MVRGMGADDQRLRSMPSAYGTIIRSSAINRGNDEYGNSSIPPVTGKCGSSAGKNNLAFCISRFAACGSFGSAIGPLYVVFMISLLGKTFFPLMLLPIFAICLYIWHHTSAPISTELLPQDKADITGFISNIKYLLSKVGGVVMMASLRDATFQGIKIFLPMLIITRGGTIAAGGFFFFAITLAGTAAGIAGGKLADTVGDERILIASMSVSYFGGPPHSRITLSGSANGRLRAVANKLPRHNRYGAKKVPRISEHRKFISFRSLLGNSQPLHDPCRLLRRHSDWSQLLMWRLYFLGWQRLTLLLKNIRPDSGYFDAISKACKRAALIAGVRYGCPYGVNFYSDSPVIGNDLKIKMLLKPFVRGDYKYNANAVR